MIEFTKGDLFGADCEAWVNAVNCVGVMGKGIASEFKVRFPEMFEEYKSLCKKGALTPGKLHLWRNPANIPKWIVNFPTKDNWRHKSKYEWIIAGLRTLKEKIGQNKISSIAIPALGCSNGGLEWQKVKRLIEDVLLDESDDMVVDQCRIIVYEPKD